jgi:hypothetical protein
VCCTPSKIALKRNQIISRETDGNGLTVLSSRFVGNVADEVRTSDRKPWIELLAATARCQVPRDSVRALSRPVNGGPVTMMALTCVLHIRLQLTGRLSLTLATRQPCATSRKEALRLIRGLSPSLGAGPCQELISRSKSALITISTSCSSEDCSDCGSDSTCGLRLPLLVPLCRSGLVETVTDVLYQ